jgi:hypothetical protein
LEIAGVATDWTAATGRTNFTLYLPENPRLRDAEGSTPGDSRPWKWIDGDAFVVWDKATAYSIDAPSARILLFNLVQFAGSAPAEVLQFTAHWGIPFALPQDFRSREKYLNEEGSLLVHEWVDFASDCDDLLRLLAVTAKSELADDELLDAFLPDFSVEPKREIADAVFGKITFAEYQAESQEHRLVKWREASSPAGRLELQHRLLESKLNRIIEYQKPQFVWDARGRHFEWEASGIWQIALSQLQEVFAAPGVDIYICSVCDKPYEFIESPENRRPRSGVRTFCSKECRIEGKRESNRRSWRRHGSEWRPSGSRRKSDGQTG